MILKNQYEASLLIIFITLFASPNCVGTIQTATNMQDAVKTSTPVQTPINIATSVPPGIFALLIYPPLIMDYDVSVWKDESPYAEVSTKPAYSILNHLQSLSLETCQIGVQGPTGDFPRTPEAVQLDSVRYQVITFTNIPSGSIAYYIEDKSLAGFNYEAGISVLVVKASIAEWNECKVLAEKVLSTLRLP